MTHPVICFVAPLSLALFASAAAAAQPIATDRPGFPFSASTVEPGQAQLEASLAWESGAAGERRTTPTLLRIGLAPAWELRLSSVGLLHDVGRSGSSWGETSVGVKRRLTARPAGASFAWLTQVDLSTGDGAPGRGARPSFGLVAECALANGRSLALAQGVVAERNASGSGVAGYVGALASQPVGERARAFVELAASRIALDADGGPTVSAGFGESHLIGADAQIDIGYSAGLSNPAPDHAIAIGLSRRW